MLLGPNKSEVDTVSFLRGKDLLVYGGYVVGALGLVAGLSELGTLDLVKEVAESTQRLGEVNDLHEILQRPNEFVMGIGFLVGCGENFLRIGMTLRNLKGKIRLQGTGNGEVDEDGVVLFDSTCVDGDIPESEQDTVEPGSGLMQGWQLLNMLSATGFDQLGDNLVLDFLKGRLMGQALPTSIISTVIHAWRSVTAWGRPAERVIERSHNQMCGWTANVSWATYGLKFMHAPPVILDTINLVPRSLQVATNALEQSLLVPISLGKSMRYVGRNSSINRGKHEHK